VAHDVHSSQQIRIFLDFYHEDIARFFPDFQLKEDLEYSAYFVLRDTLPISLLIFHINKQDEMEIDLDYAIATFRDLKSGQYFFHTTLQFLGNERNVVTFSRLKVHQDYLKKIGFVATERVGELVKFEFSPVKAQ